MQDLYHQQYFSGPARVYEGTVRQESLISQEFEHGVGIAVLSEQVGQECRPCVQEEADP